MKTSSTGLSDARFVESLTAQILREVRADAGAEKISELKTQLALGQYDINPAETADKIMGLQ